MSAALEPPFRAALLMPSWLGDSVMASALIRPLAELSGGQLQLWCRPGQAALFAAHGEVGDILAFDPKGRHRGPLGLLRLRRELRAGAFRPDAIWILPDSFSAALAARSAGVPRRIGRASEGRGALLTDRLPAGRDRGRHWIDEQSDLLALWREPENADGAEWAPELPVSAEADGALLGRLAALDLAAEATCTIVPGATYGPAKRWPGFADFLRLLPKSLTPVIVGSPAERELCQELEAAVGAGRCVNLCGALDLAELAALLARTRFTVSNDTGPMHLAAAVGGRVLGLFLSTDPAWTAPRGVQVRWLAADVDCRPCFERSCPLPEMICAPRIDAWALRGTLADWLDAGALP